MEERDRPRPKALPEKGGQDDAGAGAPPYSPKLFATLWNRALGPFHRRGEFGDDHSLVNEIDRQEKRLVEFAAVVPFDPDLLLRMHRGHVIGGAEHYVFVHKDKRRVWKQTKPNRWGFRFDTPLDYLARLNCLTSYAEGLRIAVEGIAVEKGVPSFITSMAYVAGKHPDSQQLAAHFKKNEWRLLPDPTGLLVYRHDETGVVYRDAHPGNFIVAAPDVYIPIDVGIEGIEYEFIS